MLLCDGDPCLLSSSIKVKVKQCKLQFLGIFILPEFVVVLRVYRYHEWSLEKEKLKNESSCIY